MGTILLTRPDPDNDALARALDARSVPVLFAPMLVERRVPYTLAQIEGVAGVIVTSRRAVLAADARRSEPALLTLPCFAVGPATALAARNAGFADVREGAGTGADLARLIAATRPERPLLYLAARDRSPDLEAALARAGVSVTVRVVYAMAPATALPEPVAAALVRGEISAAGFYSPRSAAAFCALTGHDRFDTMRRALVCLCLSWACAEPMRAAGFARQRIAAHPDGPAMETLVLNHATDLGPRRAPGET